MSDTSSDVVANARAKVGLLDEALKAMADEIETLRRAARNRDMWKEMCARQAEELVRLRLQSPVYWTHEHGSATGHLYYFGFSKSVREKHMQQRTVEAIVDIAPDGTIAGVELVDNMPPPPAIKESSS